MACYKVTILLLLLATLVWVAGEASAATIEVKKDGTGDSTTIQGGIDMANAGDTVLVYDTDWDLGTHSGTPALEIPSDKTGLIFKGAGSERVYVYANARDGSSDSHNYVLRVAADDVTVENFRFRNDRDSYYASGVKVSGDGVTFENVGVEVNEAYYSNSISITDTSGFTIRNSQWYSTVLQGLYGTGVSSVTFEGTNQIDGNRNGIYLSGNGTQVIGGKFTGYASQFYYKFNEVVMESAISMDVTISYAKSITVSGSEFHGTENILLKIQYSENVEVTGNTYNMTGGGTAISFDNTVNVTIHDEDISGGYTAFSISGAGTKNFQVYGNTFADMAYGINSQAPEVTVRGNVFKKIFQYAVRQNGYYNTTVSGNTFVDSDIAVWVYDADSFKIKDNVMRNTRVRSTSGSSYGIYLIDSEYGVVTGNKVSQFDVAGLYYSNVNVITTEKNDIFDNNIGILITGGDDTKLMKINGNDIYDNHNYGIYTNVHVDARNNFWGSENGPYPYGSGNAVGPIEGDILAPLINTEGYYEEAQTSQEVGGLTTTLRENTYTILLVVIVAILGIVGGRLWGAWSAENGGFSMFLKPRSTSMSSITEDIYTKENPAQPATTEEFDALPKGTYYINPEDGKTHRK